MNFKAILTSNVFIKSIFVVFLFILIFISAINYRHTIALTDSTESVMRSHKVSLELEQLISYIKDAETGQRGFLITRDTVFLQPFGVARKKVNRSFKLLKQLTADNLQQQKNSDILSHLINTHFAFLEISLNLSTETSVDKYLLDRNLLKGKKVMDDIRIQIKKMIDLEMVYLKEREGKYEDDIFFTPIFILLLLLFSLLVFVFSYFKINQDLEVLKKSNQELRIKTASFQHAEIIGGFGISEWNSETKTLSYSDNLYKLLGCKPQSFEANIENYLKFVHPDDRQIIATGAEKVIENASTYARFYRIIRKDGELRYFSSLGKFISDGENYKTHIGIIKDITETHLNNIALEERNRELEQTNAEMASFNHIASHDLQEPLRKIQLFISRINEKSTENISETSKEYLTKIQTAAQRMRTLIDDLLVFSRANKSEKIFELCNLNQLLENAKQELTEVVEEKNAIIQSAQLPTLKVIPFQIQQLFINLIGNSLKYSKTNVALVIDIACEKITAKDYPMLKVVDKKVFYKITFTDNGLGFDQQYAESIFVLFNRLHQSTQYSGTGIGLSICKKIVENHAGFIIAEGQLNTGATFTVFLPE
jgi:PAS domain S-box-containing protein